MNLFSPSPRNVWHRQLVNSGAHLALFGGQPWNTFPLAEVRQATDTYLNRTSFVPDTQRCDAHLTELIVEHAQKDRGGLKDVAVLACMHHLSRDAGSGMLIALRDECTSMSRPDNPRFLRCLMLAYFANGLLVSEQEYLTAEALMRLLADPNFLSSVHNLFQTMEGLVNPTILSATYIASILDSIDFQTVFQQYLDELQASKKYMRLHNAVSWLRPMTTLPDNSTAKAVCATLIPHWEYWTAWKPNYLRLMHWEGGNFTEDQRLRLRRIFDLESPDPSGYGFSALKQSVPGGCFRLLPVVNSDITLLEHVLVLLDTAQQIPGKHAVELFIFLLVENRSHVDPDLLSLTETILDTRNDGCIKAVWQWLSNLGGSSNNNRMGALTKLLPALQTRRALQEKLGRDIASDVIEALREAHMEYAATNDVAENLALAIHGLSKAVVDATWLRQTLNEFDPNFVQGLQRFPPEDVLHNMFNSLQRSRAPVRQIQEYLGVVFGGRQGDAAALLSTIQKTIRFWAEGVESDRANLALAVNNLDDIDEEVNEACLKRILVEDLHMVRDLSRILRAETAKNHVQYYSRVHLAQLLARRRRLPVKVDQCWYMLLFSLILPRGQEIMAWSAQELPVTEWYQWLGNLRLLFPYGDNKRSIKDFGITQEQNSWWDLLLTRYKTAVLELEHIHKARGTNLKWLWFQEADYITDLLDLLQRRDNLSSFQTFLVSCLKHHPYLHVVKLVCTALSAANRASAKGQTAFQSIYARHKLSTHGWWPRAATEALMIAWRQSNEITDSDREGLGAFSGLLGLGPAVDPTGLHFARQSMLSDYANLIATAQELDRMRTDLQNDNPARTTAFLGELGVEDARLGADPSIPDKLSSVAEAVGDNEYEVCFPLSHLNPLERRAAGVDEAARLLLVRISLQNKHQPAFCVHFSPSDDGSDRNHDPWTVGGDDAAAPDGRVCGTKPTLFTYLLNRAICVFLSQDVGIPRDLVSIHEMVTTVLKSPAANCIVCSRPMGCKLWRPTVCSDTCGEVFQRAPIEVRTSHLINDPPVLDLLLNSVLAAALDSGDIDLLPGCPIPKADIPNVINSFPRLIASTSAAQLLSLIREVGITPGESLAAEREQLLSWMAIQFRGCLISSAATGTGTIGTGGLPASVPSMPRVTQFMMLNAPPDREQAFERYAAVDGIAGGNTAAAGSVTFHGTSGERLWRILTEGLLKNMGSSARREPGVVALADEARVAMEYSGSTGPGWQKSAFPNRRVLLVCELVGHSRQGVHVVSEEARVAVRYVLLCPPSSGADGGGFTVPTGPAVAEIREVVGRTFGAIRTGELGRLTQAGVMGTTLGGGNVGGGGGGGGGYTNGYSNGYLGGRVTAVW